MFVLTTLLLFYIVLCLAWPPWVLTVQICVLVMINQHLKLEQELIAPKEGHIIRLFQLTAAVTQQQAAISVLNFLFADWL